jgi:uncharacterized membrane protein YqgA involved in biofilm formation
MIGTLVNTGTILAGSLLGMAIKSRLPEKTVNIVFQAIGLFTLAIGISMSLASDRLLIVVLSLVLGTVVGQWIDIDRYLQRFSEYLRRKSSAKSGAADSNRRFTEGFVTATMLFCVGTMSILGPIEDGLGQTPNILYTKSLMDGVSSLILASTFGAAILFSTIPVLLYQGIITLFAVSMAHLMSEAMIADLTSVGGILLIGLGISILKIKEISVTNMLPALLFVILISALWN